MKIILGSSSEGRKLALKKAGYEFEVIVPDIDEKAIRSDDPLNIPILIAREKARVIKGKINEQAIAIVGDQVVICDGNLEEKPESDEEVRMFFSRYNAGHPAETISAIVVLNTENGKQEEGVDITKVYFKHVPEEVIEKYIESRQPFSQAGGFAVEHELLASYIDRVEGEIDSTQGLPIKLMKELISKVE